MKKVGVSLIRPLDTFTAITKTVRSRSAWWARCRDPQRGQFVAGAIVVARVGGRLEHLRKVFHDRKVVVDLS
jgi:hypothetical protein